METKVEVLEDNKVRIEVTIPAKDVNVAISAQYKEYARKYNFPGFRKGKAPRPVIDNALGAEAVRAAVSDDLVENTFVLAIDEAGIYTVGNPDFPELGLVEQGQDYTYSFTVGVKPTFELSSYEPVEISLPAEGATDKEIDEQIDSLTKFYVEYKDAPANTKIKQDDYVKLATSATDDEGNEVAAVTSEERLYGMGSNLLPQAFEDEILGLKKGEEKEFTIDLPEDEPAALTAGVVGKTEKLNFKVTCLAVQKQVKPEITDEWVSQNLGFESAADLRSRVAEQIETQKANILPQLKERKCLEALQERLQGEPSAEYVEAEESNLLQEFFQQLQRSGLTFDAYLQQQDIDSKQFQQDVKDQAKDVATQDLALDSWAAHFELAATPEDVEEEFKKAGVSNVKKSVEEWRKSGRLPMLREGISRQKAMEQVIEQAVVTTEEEE
ncbi:MAG: trigger factor [Coriobacteriia bacterium]|nr:trigger factor [Coriobacteriia bacterium]